jgi:hypothetical protein
MNMECVAVYLGPEVNSVRQLKNGGFASVLYGVAPHVPHDLISYSSWESLTQLNVATELTNDIESIRSISRNQNVVLGELGFSTERSGESLQKTENAISAAAEAGVAYVFLWVLYDSVSDAGYGLFDGSGNPTGLASVYHERVASDRWKRDDSKAVWSGNCVRDAGWTN